MRRIAVAVAFVAAAAACHSGSVLHPPGAESFVTPVGGLPPGGAATAGAGGVADAAAGGTTPAAAPTREVEEADVYALDGGTLYVLNAYRGLQIVDVANPAAPRLLSRVPVTGTPVDLYVRNGVAFVLTSDFFWYALDGAGAATPQVGSRMWAIEVADPAAPAVIGELPLEGRLDETRIVGDVLYAVSRRYPYDVYGGPVAGGGVATAGGGGVASGVATTGGDATLVESFDVSDPRAPRAVDRIEIASTGWDTHANVTAERITLSQSGWDASGAVTTLEAIDIRDPGGKLAGGAAVSVPGRVPDRWAMDLEALPTFAPGTAGLFRAVVDPGWNAGARVLAFAWPDPAAAPAKLSELTLDVAESLTASRFDGARIYVVTAARTDPLWVVDGSDPTRPVLGGHLQMPGQLDYIEPRGDRLVALGHTNEAGLPFQLSVRLFDVADPKAPAQIGAPAVFGPSWAWVPASPDDLRKAFQVLDGAGLVLVPWQGWDPGTWRWRGGTQLVTYARDGVATAGSLDHAGSVKRAFPLGVPGKLAALSDESLQTIDAADPSLPAELAALDLARPVVDLAVVNGIALELSGDFWRGAFDVVTTPALDPEAAVPLGRLSVAAPAGRIWKTGDTAWIGGGDPWGGNAFVASLDASDPAAPRIRARLDLPDPAGAYGWWYFGWTPEVLAGDALALLRFSCAPAPSPAGGCTYGAEVVVVDLADPDRPRVASVVPLGAAGWTGGLVAAGTDVWYSKYEWVAGEQAVRYSAGRIGLADPYHPALSAPVNVPGWFVGASPDGRRLYTIEAIGGAGAGPVSWFHALEPTDHGTARLVASARLDGWFWGASLAGGFLYATGQVPEAATVATAAGTATVTRWTTRLAAIRVDAMAVESVQAVEAQWGWLAKAAGGKLFVAASARSPAMLVYGLADPGHPALERTVRTSGWVYDVVVEGSIAYLPSGPYGVPMVPLGGP